MGIAHLDEVDRREIAVGHLRAHWTFIGQAAGCRGVGVRRIEVAPGAWSTPAHDHGAGEEIFYVLGGRGLSWHDGKTAEIAAGDCVVYMPGRGPHTLHAGEAGLDVLAFGPRLRDESPAFPRLGLSFVGRRAAPTLPATADGLPIHFAREAELGPPDLPASPTTPARPTSSTSPTSHPRS